jgi:hypothetical protein
MLSIDAPSQRVKSGASRRYSGGVARNNESGAVPATGSESEGVRAIRAARRRRVIAVGTPQGDV